MVRNPFNNRPGLKALLLIGGAFSLVAAYLAWNYHLVADPAAAWDPKFYTGAENELVAIVSLTGHPSSLKNLLSRLPETAQSSLREYPFGNRPAVVIVQKDRRTGVLDWGYLPANRFPWGRFRLIDKNASGYGFFNENSLSEPDSPSAEWTLPFEIYAENHVVRLKVGHDYRGFLKAPGSAGGGGRRLKALPDELETYLYDPSPFSGTMVLTRGLLPKGNAPFPELAALLGQIPGPLEIAIGRRSDSSATSTFIIHGRLPSKAAEGSERIALSIRKYLGMLDPDALSVLLQDKTAAIELRNSSNKVISEEFELKNGRLSKFYSANGRRQIAYFRENSGDVWIADSTDTIRNVILSSIGGVPSRNDRCLPGGDMVGLIFSRPAWLPSFNTVSFLFNNPETGLFTICGYF